MPILARPFVDLVNLVSQTIISGLSFHIRTFTMWRTSQVSKAYSRIVGKITAFYSLLGDANKPSANFYRCTSSENALFAFDILNWVRTHAPLASVWTAGSDAYF